MMNINQTPDIDRMLVVGPTGSGKSFAADRLSHILDKPLVSLDRLMLDENGKPKPKEQFVEEAEEFFAQPEYEEGWVVDGTYRSLRHITWDKADLIGYIRPPVILNAALISLRALTRDTTGGNSDQSISEQLERLRKTRRWDLEKLDHTTAEYRAMGKQVIQTATSSGLIRSVMHHIEASSSHNLGDKQQL